MISTLPTSSMGSTGSPHPKVLHVITGLGNGGAEAVLVRLCRSIAADIECHVVSLRAGGSNRQELEAMGIQVTELDMEGPLSVISGMARLVRLIRRARPDVVQTWMYHGDLLGGIAARIAGVRQVFWNVRHSSPRRGNSSLSSVVTANICALLSRWVPKVIVFCTEGARQAHEKLGYQGCKSVVIENGFDDQRFQMLRSDSSTIGDQFRIGMLARYHPVKGHELVFRVVSDLVRSGVNVSLCLAGPMIASDNERLMQQLRHFEIEDNVSLLGPMRAPESFYHGIDFYVLASSSEGFPNVVAEAMLSGVPCIVSDVGAARRIVSDEGWVVAPGDAGQLRAGIREARAEFLTDYLSWRRRQQRCRQRVQSEFGIRAMTNNYLRVWNL